MGDFAPVIPAVMFLAIPIVAILTRHQRQMAEILQRRGEQDGSNAALAQEVARLRELVSHQTLMLDDISRRQELMSRQQPTDSVQERLKA